MQRRYSPTMRDAADEAFIARLHEYVEQTDSVKTIRQMPAE
jgi:hypothetical protein